MNSLQEGLALGTSIAGLIGGIARYWIRAEIRQQIGAWQGKMDRHLASLSAHVADLRELRIAEAEQDRTRPYRCTMKR